METKHEKNGCRNRTSTFLAGIIFLEAFVFLLLVLITVLPISHQVFAAVSADNVTVPTTLTIGNVYPEIINVTVQYGAASVDLSANSTVEVTVTSIVRDYDGEGDIANVSTIFFDAIGSTYGATDDNNNHYSNNSCTLNYAYGDAFTLESNCTFSVQYYAANSTWNATSLTSDNSSLTAYGSDIITINTLLALGLPDVINYGEVNATDVSNEIVANVTNYGNVFMNLSLSGYGATAGDGLAMNCTLGNIQNISIEYEKFNLTSSNNSELTHAQVNSLYTNLTNTSAVKQFDLSYRTNDTLVGIGDTNSTYWRIYVPVGVAGSCSGNIVFGSVISPAT